MSLLTKEEHDEREDLITVIEGVCGTMDLPYDRIELEDLRKLARGIKEYR